MSAFVRVQCPPGGKPGDTVPITMPGSSVQYTCIIPGGVGEGQFFEVPIAAGTPVDTERSRLNGTKRYSKYGGAEYVMGNGPEEGQAFSCCLCLNAMFVFIFLLVLCANVSYYYNVVCSPYWGWYGQTCFYNNWVTYNALTADKLPFDNVTTSNGWQIRQGDGGVDYWSLVVAVSCGLTGSLIVMCCILPTSLRRGGAARVIACGTAFAFCLHMTSIAVIAEQLLIAKHQWVYNPFCGVNAEGNAGTNTNCDNKPVYQWLDPDSVANYWVNDHYFGWYGVIVYVAFSFMCVLALFELLYVLVAMCASEEKSQRYTGVNHRFAEDSGWFF